MKNVSIVQTTLILFLLITCSVVCLSCQQAPDNNKIDISAEEFAKQKDQPNVIVLDVRTTREYQQGHLAEAVFMDMYQPGFREDILKLDKEKTYYIYCHSGGRSHSATKFMRQNGFKNVFNVDGGIISMSRAGIQFTK